MDRHLSICKAVRTGSETPSAEIAIDVELPEFSGDGWQGRCCAFYQEQAEQLEATLYATLPGGTYSSLLERMLHRRACHFRVSFFGVMGDEEATP